MIMCQGLDRGERDTKTFDGRRKSAKGRHPASGKASKLYFKITRTKKDALASMGAGRGENQLLTGERGDSLKKRVP